MEAGLESVGAAILQVLQGIGNLFIQPGSVLSLSSLGCALLAGVAFLAIRRRRRGRQLSFKLLVRAVFPRRILRHHSTALDAGYALFNIFVYGGIVGWALFSYQLVANGTAGTLAAAFGTMAPTLLSDFTVGAIVTAVSFLAYEFGYWLHHYALHRVPLLWEFHKVHHTANVLTPLTVFRVHLIEQWLFSYFLAISIGVASGIANYALGVTAYQYAITKTNIILVVFIHLYVHLQHTHLWISFRGIWGRLFMSPAHHQIHHSNAPQHYNRNLGSCLAIWDWMFGTLYMPARESEKLTYGVAADGRDTQTITELYLAPFARVGRYLAGLVYGPTAKSEPTLDPLPLPIPAPEKA